MRTSHHPLLPQPTEGNSQARRHLPLVTPASHELLRSVALDLTSALPSTSSVSYLQSSPAPYPPPSSSPYPLPVHPEFCTSPSPPESIAFYEHEYPQRRYEASPRWLVLDQPPVSPSEKFNSTLSLLLQSSQTLPPVHRNRCASIDQPFPVSRTSYRHRQRWMSRRSSLGPEIRDHSLPYLPLDRRRVYYEPQNLSSYLRQQSPLTSDNETIPTSPDNGSFPPLSCFQSSYPFVNSSSLQSSIPFVDDHLYVQCYKENNQDLPIEESCRARYNYSPTKSALHSNHVPNRCSSGAYRLHNPRLSPERRSSHTWGVSAHLKEKACQTEDTGQSTTQRGCSKCHSSITDEQAVGASQTHCQDQHGYSAIVHREATSLNCAAHPTSGMPVVPVASYYRSDEGLHTEPEPGLCPCCEVRVSLSPCCHTHCPEGHLNSLFMLTACFGVILFIIFSPLFHYLVP